MDPRSRTKRGVKIHEKRRCSEVFSVSFRVARVRLHSVRVLSTLKQIPKRGVVIFRGQ